MTVVIVVDSGTTNTRVRLWDGKAVAASAAAQVGARNTAMDGHTGQLQATLKQLIESVQAESALQPEAVLFSGMITANVGLLEVPHITAPAGLHAEAQQIARHDFPQISSLPFYFIPGVKSVPAELTADTLSEADIMRGEETEVAGLREVLGLSGPALFMHYGSHHKAIIVDDAGRILQSRTSMTGELYMAVAQNTVLKSSILPLDEVVPIPEMWRLGLAQAHANGFGRALFLTRVAEQIWKRSKAEATSYLLGVLLHLDLPLLAGAREQNAAVVLYGKGHFPGMLKAYLDEQGWPDVRQIDDESTELAAVVGAVRIYERKLALERGAT